MDDMKKRDLAALEADEKDWQEEDEGRSKGIGEREREYNGEPEGQ